MGTPAARSRLISGVASLDMRGGRPWLMLESATGNNLTGGRNSPRPEGPHARLHGA
nr:hypothetical protein [Streptomyces cyaneochromogenes]